jgi:hypothetical protein
MSPRAELTAITLFTVGATVFAVIVRDTVSLVGAGGLLVGVGAAWWALLRWENRPRIR